MDCVCKKKHEFCKIEVRHTLKRKKSFFDFLFSNSKLLCNKQLGDYLRKSKKQIFLNNICLTSILQEPLNLNVRAGPAMLWVRQGCCTK